MPAAARWFRVIALVEAVSWTALLVAMFLKWVLHVQTPHEGGVPVVGPIHGVGFVVYLLSVLWVAVTLKWPLKTTAIGLAAGVPPFGTVVFERHVQRRGLLSRRTSRTTATAAQG